MTKRILHWELREISFIVVLGSLLHSIFEWFAPTIPIAPIVLVMLVILFILFTFYPLHLPLFSDSVTRGYGIVG